MISHFHRTVFIHIPKCGGQSVEAAFLSDLGLTWELRAPLLLRPNDEPRLGPPRLAHLLAREDVHYHYLSQDLYDTYYTFAILRHPAARAVSLFNDLKVSDARRQPLSFDAFLNEWLPRQFAFRHSDTTQQYDPSNRFYFVRPQVEYIAGPGGSLLVKDVFFLERIANDFSSIKLKAGLRSQLGHRNKSRDSFTLGNLTDDHHRVIRQLYADDFHFIESRTFI